MTPEAAFHENCQALSGIIDSIVKIDASQARKLEVFKDLNDGLGDCVAMVERNRKAEMERWGIK